jgi:hypothetical protein
MESGRECPTGDGDVWPEGAPVPTFPRGAITEITGALSSGRTALLHAALAEAAQREECCAVVDCNGVFDPLSAAQAGVNLQRLLWVRGGGNLDVALKAADMILHSGGFGVVVLDLCEAASRDLNRIPLSSWYRFRNAVENSPTRLVVACHVPVAKACARLQLEIRRKHAVWKGSTPLFVGMESEIETKKQRIAMAG